MITAVDSNVLLDVFGADTTFGERSKNAIRTCLSEGSLMACEVVWAEVAGFFPSSEAAREAMQRLEVTFTALTLESALLASSAWKSYRERGGQKKRVVADFLIGAHALSQSDRLLTRDRGFYRTYFAQLRVVDPT
ncbi:MAG: type II toxin-antitoxin system VapC family toxin [Acidobacteriota bacterium]